MMLWAVFAALLSWRLAPLARLLAIRFGAIDEPSARKVHAAPTPRLGGIAVIGAAVVVFVIRWLLGPEEPIGPSQAMRPAGQWGFAFLLGAAPIVAVSIRDDIRHVRAIWKFLAQLVGAIIVVVFGISLGPWVHLFGREVWIGPFGFPLSVLWLVGVTNAFNIIDGLDGLSAGLGLISAIGMAAVFGLTGQPEAATLSLVIAGALAGFLPYNLHPAKMFLGDSGAAFIGFCLGCLALSGAARLSAGFAVLIPIVALGVPVVDTLLAVARRLMRRVVALEPTGVFSADRNHIHHRLLALGLSHRHAVLLLYGIGAATAAAAMASIWMTDRQAGLVLVGLLTAGFVGIARLGYEEFALIRSGLVLRFYEAPAFRRSFLIIFVDLGISALAVYAAIGLRSDDWPLAQHRELAVQLFALISATTPVAFWLLGLYRGALRLVGLYDVRRLIIALVGANAVTYAVIDQVFHQTGTPPILAIGFLIQVILSVTARTSYKVLLDMQWRAAKAGERALIFGAGSGGMVTLRELLSNPSIQLTPVGFLDEDPLMTGRIVQGFPIVGTPTTGEAAIKRLRATAIVISTDEVSEACIRQLGNTCAASGIRLLQMTISVDDISRSRVRPRPVPERPLVPGEHPAAL